jgi:hypothetical protein
VSRNATRPPLRKFACFVAIALAAGVLAACGGGGEQSLTFTLTDQGGQMKVTGPQGAESGIAEITLQNEAKGENNLQLIRAVGEHSAQEVAATLRLANRGRSTPSWFILGGGVGGVAPGESGTVTQVLRSGTYFALSTEGPPDPSSLARIEVSGAEAGDELPDADTTVTAFEYGYETEALPSGQVEIQFENDGIQPHHLLAARLTGDSTAADVERFFKTKKGKLPLREDPQSTAVVDGGEGQIATLDLKPGRYAFYCLVRNRLGGPRHVLRGMVDEVEVK